MNEIVPTIVPTTFAALSEAVERYASFAPQLHLDCADGIFAPNLTWLPEHETLPHSEHILFEAHLMVADPHMHGVAAAHAGARRIIGHIEAFNDTAAVHAAFKAWKEAGAEEVGLAMLCTTSRERIEQLIVECDVLQVMTIASIGTQGNPFDPQSIRRIEEIHHAHPDVCISVDGGLTKEHIATAARAGARRFAVGSTLAQAADPLSMYKELSGV